MAGAEGFEPPTYRFGIGRSTVRAITPKEMKKALMG